MQDTREIPVADLVAQGRMTVAEAIEYSRKPTGGEMAQSIPRTFNRAAGEVLLSSAGMLTQLASKGAKLGGQDSVAGALDALSTSLGQEGGGIHDKMMGLIPPEDPQMENLGWWGQRLARDLPAAAGSMAAMAAVPGTPMTRAGLETGGWAMGGIKAAAASRGALVQGAQGFFEARAAGADETKQWTSFAANAVLGTTEAGIPGLPANAFERLGKILARSDKASGGGLRRLVTEGLKSGSSEAFQEAVQQFGSNIVAKELYEDDRDLLAGVESGAYGGFMLGLLGGAAEGLAAPHGKNVREVTDKPRAQEKPLQGIEGLGADIERPVKNLSNLPADEQDAVKEFSSGIGSGQIEVYEPTEADQDIVDFVQGRGATPVLVGSRDGNPLPKPAAYSSDGRRVFLDVNAQDARAALIDHEVAHDTLENFPGAREEVIRSLRPELLEMALRDYHADRVASEIANAGRDLTPEEIQAIESEQINPDEAIARLSEDFSPVIRLLRENPQAFSKIQDVGFWRGMVRAALDVVRGLRGKPKSQEIALANKLRSLKLRGVAAVVEPTEALEIANTLKEFLDLNLGEAAVTSAETVTAAQPNAANAAAVPQPGAPPKADGGVKSQEEIGPGLDTTRARALMSMSNADLDVLAQGRIAKEQAALKEQFPDRDQAWHDRVAELRRQARDPENAEGDRAALQLKRAGIEPSGANVEEVLAVQRERAKGPAGKAQYQPGAAERVAGQMQFAEKRESDIGHKREKESGRYVGAPKWIGSSPDKLRSLRVRLERLAKDGGAGRDWYENSSKAILSIANGDTREATKIAGLIAIYSPNAEVSANATMALRAYYQWKAGMKIKAGMGTANAKAQAWMDSGKGWSGEKTNNFFQDLVTEIDPSLVDPNSATMDLWIARAFKYDDDAIQGAKYGFAKREVSLVAEKFGWTPRQAQAAIWTGQRLEAGAQSIDDAKYDFGDALAERSAQLSWEATPSKDTSDIPGIFSAPLEQLSEYLVAVDNALHQNGRDLIADAVGLPAGRSLFGPSAWQGDVGAGAQRFLPISVETVKGKRQVRDEARKLLNLYAALRGLVLKQDGVYWHLPIHGEAMRDRNAIEIRSSQGLTTDEVRTLYDAIHSEFGHWKLAPGYTDNGARILNFVDGLSNKAFQDGMRRVIESLPENFGGGKVEHAFYRSDGDPIENNWRTNPNGEEYRNRIAAERPDLLGQADRLRARVEAVNTEFASKYKWDKPAGKLREAQPRRGQTAPKEPSAAPIVDKGSGVLPQAQPRRPSPGLPAEEYVDRYGMKGSEWTKTMATKLTSRDYLQDNLGPLRRIVNSAKELGIKTDPYMAMELAKGKAKERIDVESKDYVKPVVDAIVDTGLDVDDVEIALLARAAHDRNALIYDRTTKFDEDGNAIPGSGRMNGSGMTDDEASKILAQVGNDPKYQKVFKAWDALNARVRQLWVEYGLESQEMVDGMAALQPHFAPFRSSPDVTGAPRSGGRQIRGREFKAALGRSSMAENPIVYALQDLESAVARGERNVALEKLYDWAKELKDPNVALVDVPPMRDALVNGEIRKVPDFQEAENEVLLKVNGETRRVRFSAPYDNIARAIKGLDNETGGAVTEAVGHLTRMIAGLSTRWNPFFPLVNVFRDTFGASFNAQSAYFLSPERMAWALKELKNDGAWAQRYRASGAPTAFMDLSPRAAERAVILKKEIGDLQKHGEVKRHIGAKVAQAISALNDVTEGMTRLNAFRYAIEELGMTEDQAASFSKNLTTNFERHGQAQWLNAWFAFSNAGIQGAARTLQALKKPGARKLAAALVAGAAALDAMNRVGGGDDEDGIAYYDKIPDYIRRSHAIIMLPGTKGDYIRLPLPFVWGWFHVVGTETMRGAQLEKPGEAAAGILTSLIDNVNPVGSAGEPLDSLTPTLLDPIVQANVGKNFAGKNIYPANYDKRPDSELAWDNTNKFLVQIARSLNSMTGGSRAESGLIDISPLTIEHLIRSYTGGVGGEITRIERMAEKAASGESIEFADVPLWRRFFGEVGAREQAGIFKDHVHEVEVNAKLKKMGEPFNKPLARLHLRAKAWQDKIGDLQDAIDATEDVSKKDQLREKIRQIRLDAVRIIRESQK